jgi:hypothetical protein
MTAAMIAVLALALLQDPARAQPLDQERHRPCLRR